MYNNVGQKIKDFAVVAFTLMAMVSIIGGIGFIVDEKIEVGLPMLLLGPISAWISSWFIYGFGKLIENSDIIVQHYKRVNQKANKADTEKKEQERKQTRSVVKAILEDPKIGEDEIVDVICPNCDAELSYMKEQLRSGEKMKCPMCDTLISFD